MKAIQTAIIVVLMSAFSTVCDGGEINMLSVGDSVSVAFNAKRWLSNREYSWTTGTRVESHRQRIEDAIGTEVGSVNVAVAGAKSSGLIGQVNLAFEVYSKYHYATMLIGHNDLCNWKENTPEKFESNTKYVISELTKANPEIKILFSAIPNMLKMREVGLSKGCSNRWKTFRICQSLLGEDVSQEELEKFESRQDIMNDVIERISDENDNVIYAGSPRYEDFKEEDISGKDCYHPSPIGQRKLSELTWESFRVGI